jgi:transposase
METMSRKQWKRLEVVERLAAGEWTTAAAAEAIGITDRQMRRIRRRHEAEGQRCVAHGNRGRSPPNKVQAGVRASIIALREGRYEGRINDTHFTEKLAEEEQIRVSRSTVRRILRAHGIASSRRHRSGRYFRKRKREAQAGMMVLWDGSDHDWLEGRGPRLCLIGGVDDATGEMVDGTHFVEEESSAGYFRVLRQMVWSHGIPWKMYMDKHSSLCRNDDHWTRAEELAGKQEPTQVGRALEALGIEVIFANTPQAKGRVERMWGTAQDRLTTEMRLAGVSTLAEANAFLKRYRVKHNRKFGKRPAESRPAWRLLPKSLDLDRICSFITKTSVGNDNTIKYQGCEIALPPRAGHRTRAGHVVEVSHSLEGRIRVFDGEEELVVKQADPLSKSPKRRRLRLAPIQEKPKRQKQTLKQILARYRKAA